MSTANPTVNEAAAPGNGRRRLLLRLVLLIVVLALIGVGVWYYLVGRWHESTDDAYVNGNVVQITPQVVGTVVKIQADNGDLVHKGDVLVEIDGSDARIALQQAEANLARTVRQVRGLYSNVESGQALVAAQKIALDRTRADFTRRKGLAATGAISAEELAHARDALAAAESQLSSTQQQLSTSKALVDETVIAKHPDVLAAAANLRSAWLNNVRSRIYAPLDGYVAQRTVQVGQRIQPGTALMAVVPLMQAKQVWVDANFKETQLAEMRIGQPVRLVSDLYGGQAVYHGKVESLGVGTGSAFSLLPAQNATGNWIKIVQRLPVRVALDPREVEKSPLRIGLSMRAEVDLHDSTGLSLAAQAPSEPKFSTDIYTGQVQGAEAEIERIVHDNVAGAGGRGEREVSQR